MLHIGVNKNKRHSKATRGSHREGNSLPSPMLSETLYSNDGILFTCKQKSPFFRAEIRAHCHHVRYRHTFWVVFNYLKSVLEMSWYSPLICSGISVGSSPVQEHHFGINIWVNLGQSEVRCLLTGFCNISSPESEVNRRAKPLSFLGHLKFLRLLRGSVVKAGTLRLRPGTLKAEKTCD